MIHQSQQTVLTSQYKQAAQHQIPANKHRLQPKPIFWKRRNRKRNHHEQHPKRPYVQ